MKNERAIARLTQSSQADRKEGDLRAVGAMSWLCIHYYLSHPS